MFDIIIPTYNNLENLKKCLSAFVDQTYKDFVILICVDGSNDGTVEFLKSSNYKFELKILEHEDKKNKGRNAARNLALNYIRSEYIAMIDSDIIPDTGFLENHFNLLKKKKCISVGEVIYTNSKTNLWANYIQKRGKGRYKDKEEIPEFYFTSGNAAMPAEFFIKLQGQDPEMKTYGGGDSEFGIRFSKYFTEPVLYNQKAIGYSEMDKSIDFALNQMEEFGNINLKYIRAKHPDQNELFKFKYLFSDKNYIRILFIPVIYNIILKLVKILPVGTGKILIKYLVAYKIYKGFNRN